MNSEQGWGMGLSTGKQRGEGPTLMRAFDGRLSDGWRRHWAAFAPPAVAASLQTVRGTPRNDITQSIGRFYAILPFNLLDWNQSKKKSWEVTQETCGTISSASQVPTLGLGFAATLVDLMTQRSHFNLLWVWHSWISWVSHNKWAVLVSNEDLRPIGVLGYKNNKIFKNCY